MSETSNQTSVSELQDPTAGFGYYAVGNMTIDDLVFADGSTRWCVPGGNAIYAALGMAVWAERPSLISVRGPDYPVKKLRGRIDLSSCRPFDRTLRNWGLYENDGTRTFVFRRETSDWSDFSPQVEDLDQPPYRHAHIAALPWELQIAIAGELKRSGTDLLSLDLDDRLLQNKSSVEMRQLLVSIDLFLPSAQDVQALFPGRDLLDALRELRAIAPELPMIAIKCGADGVILHRTGSADYIHIPSAVRDVVDVTGAGDAFCGGALVGYARNGDPVDACLRGSVSATFAIASLGADALVEATLEEAERRLERLRHEPSAHLL